MQQGAARISRFNIRHYVNPPTLFLVVTNYIDRLSDAEASDAQKEAGKEYLRGLYPLITRNYEWFRKDSRETFHDIRREREAFSRHGGYFPRWRGRTPEALPSPPGSTTTPERSLLIPP